MARVTADRDLTPVLARYVGGGMMWGVSWAFKREG